jgi:hypothetical protein
MSVYGHQEPRRSYGCSDKVAHGGAWRVMVRRANYSAFNGYHRTPSLYSQLTCTECGAVWRTKAAYVSHTPNLEVGAA